MKKNGFTLIEILASLAIMSVFATVALTSMTNVVDDARYSQTQREMEVIRAALVGETQRLETGLRKNYGYLGDMGALPTTSMGISALVSKPSGVPNWGINASYGIGVGWKGPYLNNTPDQNYYNDAWGNAFQYTYNSSTGAATIISYGADNSSGGTGFNTDIVLNIPNSVTGGKIYGYVVAAKGDVVGADQVPFSANAQIYVYYPNGSGGIASSSQTIGAAQSGAYSFTGLPLGYGAVKVFIPTSASPTQTIGPSIIEINKAAAAAVPIAQDTSNIYTSAPNCASGQDFTVSSGSYSLNATSSQLQFTVSFPAAYTWSGASSFYAEQERNNPIAKMTITNIAASTSVVYMLSGGIIRSSSAGGAWTSIPSNSYQTVSNIVFGANSYYQIVFDYASVINASDSVFYYQIGCKFLRAYPGM